MGLSNLVENIAARGLKDILDPEVRAAYAEFKDIEKNGIFLQYEDIIPYCEQVVYRMSKCAPCVAGGKCWDCKCPVPDKMLAPTAKCSQNNWGPMEDSAAWKAKNIQFVAIE